LTTDVSPGFIRGEDVNQPRFEAIPSHTSRGVWEIRG
jgi:hypothetical protein